MEIMQESPAPSSLSNEDKSKSSEAVEKANENEGKETSAFLAIIEEE